MEQYIPKAAVVSEIERIEYETNYESFTDEVFGKRKVCKDIKDFLDTIEVKEADLENELKEDWLFADKTEVDCLECMCLTEDMFVSLAKKYFALGLKAQKL